MQNIDSDLIRGNIDTIILKTMLDGDKYGLDIIKEVEIRSNGTYELKQPTLYSCLKRLENQELISSYWVDSDIGGRRHYYKLTAKGHESLEKKQEEWAKSKFIIDNLLGNFAYDEYRLVKKDDYDKIIEGKENEPLPAYDSSLISNTNTLQSLNEEVAKTDEAIENSFAQPSSEPDTSQVYGETNYSAPSLSQENLEEDQTEFETLNNEMPAGDLEAEENHIYFNTPNEDKSDFDDDELISLPKKDSAALSAQENNILSMLRRQDDEEINTYYGDQKSYVNQLNFTKKDPEIVQQNLLDGNFDDGKSKVDRYVEEFENNIRNLNNFDSSGESTEEDETLDLPDMPEEMDYNLDLTEAEYEPYETYNYNSEEFEDEDEVVNVIEDFDEVEPETFDETTKIINQSTENTYADETYADETAEIFSTADSNYLDELDEIDSHSQKDFAYDLEDKEYEQTTFDSFSTPSQAIVDQTETEETENKPFDFLMSSTADEPVSESTTQTYESSSDFDNQTYETYDYEDPVLKSTYRSNYEEYYNFVDNSAEYPTKYTNGQYRQKIEDLSQYTKTTPETSGTEFEAKDIENLKAEFEKEGIEVRTYQRGAKIDEADKTYLLLNKLNLVKSVILMFVYIFVLSAMYIILNSTSFKDSYGFSFNWFILGFIPIGVYMLYCVIKYLINPYRKIPAKYAAGIMIFISVIITVQLLLITYCVNLQLGFYSFTQESYNHLQWIVPTIVSFAPIISTLIFTSLFYSRNFNV